jgi:hypothetical protein
MTNNTTPITIIAIAIISTPPVTVFLAYYVSSPQLVKWTDFLVAAGFKPPSISRTTSVGKNSNQ